MSEDSVTRLEKNAEFAMERVLKRFEESLDRAYSRPMGSVRVSPEDRGNQYLTMAGDPSLFKAWIDNEAATHGMPMARTRFVDMVKDGEKYVNKLMGNGPQSGQE